MINKYLIKEVLIEQSTPLVFTATIEKKDGLYLGWLADTNPQIYMFAKTDESVIRKFKTGEIDFLEAINTYGEIIVYNETNSVAEVIASSDALNEMKLDGFRI